MVINIFTASHSTAANPTLLGVYIHQLFGEEKYYMKPRQSILFLMPTMKTLINNLWLLALAFKCTQENIAGSLLIMATSLWLATTFFYWCHPGGPAWGKYYPFYSSWRKTNNLNNLPSPPSTTGHSVTKNPMRIPGPRGYPIIGSMNLMSSPLPHHRIAAAAKACRATRLMSFSLGDTRAIVTCHPDVAREILHSPVFADRPIKGSAYALMFDRAIGFAPYGVYWRTLRKIATEHFFSPMQIKSSESQRSQIAAQMVRSFRNNGSLGHGLTVRQILKRASLSNMMWSVFGQRYRLHGEPNEEKLIRGLVEQGYDLLGELNWGDHLPFLKDYFDSQRISSELVPRMNRFVSTIIADHQADDKTHTHRDFVHVLLSLQEPDKLSESDMIAVLWEMIFRGSDTVAVLMEWILARMVLHPDVQGRVQKELDEVAVTDGVSRAATEDDMAATVYLPAVVKEVLRMHPPDPLLSCPRLAMTNTTIDGYHVPAGTTAMVNMWAIARDPGLWSDPLEFKPERFMGEEGEPEFSVLGSDLRLAPFGSGRRCCPGQTMGLTVVTFWVAKLLHEFEWLPSDEGNGVDLTEVLRVSCEMANPLTVKVCPRA